MASNDATTTRSAHKFRGDRVVCVVERCRFVTMVVCIVVRLMFMSSYVMVSGFVLMFVVYLVVFFS